METRSADKRIWTWVSEDGKSAAAGMSLGAGGGMKTGAGGHPQPYGWHAYYGETGGEGGDSSGPVFRGRVTPPHEVRGKVTPPEKQTSPPPAPPAAKEPLHMGGRVRVSTKNDETGKPAANTAALETKAREQVQATLDKARGVKEVNLNSAYRSGNPKAHGEGRAVDINQVNGQKVSDAIDPSLPAEQREAMRERLEEIKTAAEANKEVEAYIDPLDGHFRPAAPNSRGPGRKAKPEEIHDHRHHIHITIRKSMTGHPMHILLLLIITVILFGPPTEACAQRVKITYHAAETEPESAEENAAHAEGRAVDINEVNKMSVRLAVDPSAPKAKREEVRERLREIEASARSNPEVELFLSPIGGFHRDARTKNITHEATKEEIKAHWDHIHMTIMK